MGAQTIATVALVIAVLTSFFFGGGMTIFFGARVSRGTTRAEALHVQLDAAASALGLAQATAVEAIMNVSALIPVVTVLQSGTYTMECDGGDIVSGAAWKLERVLIASAINFTVLVLESPTVPCAWPTFGASSQYAFFMYDFEPSPFAPYGRIGGEVIHEFSAENKARIQVSTGCIASGACALKPYFTRTTIVSSSLSISSIITVTAPAEPGEVASVDFSEPLQIILPLL